MQFLVFTKAKNYTGLAWNYCDVNTQQTDKEQNEWIDFDETLWLNK